MIITCPNCATRYSLDETNIPVEGRQVRCAQCAHVWHQDQSEPNDLLSLDQDAQDATGDAVPQLEDEPDSKPEPEAEDDSFEIEIEDIDESESADDSEPAEAVEPSEDPDDTDSPAEAEEAEATDDPDAAEELEEPEDGTEDGGEDSAEGEAEDEVGGDAEDEAEDGAKDGADIQEARIAEWRATRARERASAAEAKPDAPRSDMRGWIILVVVVATVIGAAAGFREQISSAWPPSQRLYDMIDGLFAPGEPEEQEAEEPEPEEEPEEAPKEIAIDVTSSRVAVIDGQRVLLIEGMISNASQSDLAVPAMHGALLDGNGEALHEWTFSVPFASIKAGTQREFETRVVEPPSGARVMKLDPLIKN